VRKDSAIGSEIVLEGIVAKNKDNTYISGQSDWIKVKTTMSDSFIVVGYGVSGVARAGLAALSLPARKGSDFVYVGSVGTGFNEQNAEQLRRTVDRLKRKRASVDYTGRGKNLAANPYR